MGEKGVAPLALSPDGTLLATRALETESGRAVPVSLWDLRDRPRLVGRLPATVDTPDTAFAPDGRTLVTVTTDEAVRVTWWSVTDPAHPAQLASRGFAAVNDRTSGPIVFTPDGRRMFVTVGTAPGAVWDTSDPASPELLTTVRPVRGSDTDRAMLRGPALVLSAPGAVDVWDVTDPEEVSEAAAFSSGDENAFYFDHFAVTPDGLLAATHLAQGTRSVYTGEALVRLWDLRPILDAVADPVAAACRIAGHDLGAELWRQYAPGVQVRPICR
jgi:WD40 repeat protein